jgi:hypothetical protein
VEGEWLLDPQRDDGTVTNMPVFSLLLVIALGGFLLLLAAAVGLRRMKPTRSRPARTGAALTIAGAALLSLFASSALVTALLTGAPWEPTFIAFLLGMLLLALGPVTWGLSLRREQPASGVWQMLMVSGIAALAALAIEPDPWHDASLVLIFTAWSVLGVLLTSGWRTARQSREDPGRGRASSRAR